MNQKSVRITSALTALGALAAAVVAALAVSSSGILSAQSASTTRIDLLNVGMCVTTDDSVFKEADCDDGDGNKTFNVGDRDEIVERETVYATYAHDPTNSGDPVRAIVTNSDLLKVSISDPGRDRRRTVLYPVSEFEGILSTTAVLDKIRSELGDSVDDEAALTEFHGQHETTPGETTGIKVKVFDPADPNGDDAEISQSGTSTLVLYRAGGTSQDYPFQPLSVKTDDEENYVDTVQWYGYVVDANREVDSAYVASNASTLIDLGSSGSGTERRVVNLIADEDRTSGSTEDDIAPWMVVQANVPPTEKVVIVAVAYETSEREIITGGQKCDAYTESEAMANTAVETDDCKPNSAQSAVKPYFTSSELSGSGDELVAEVEGEGDALYLSLKETAPFSGTYTGYIRLTDADGNGQTNVVRGSDGELDRTGSRANWGYQLKDADEAAGNADPDLDDAAVVGVSDRLTIKYVDSEGDTTEIRVSIDNTPPRITVTSPEDGSSDDDRSPDFIGQIVDPGSGLAEETFRLYVDNTADGGVGNPGDRQNDKDFVLNIPSGITNTTRVTAVGNYRGWSDSAPTFGVLSGNRDRGSRIYFREDGTKPPASLTENTAARKIVLADDYDDGDQEAVFDDDARIEGTDDPKKTIAGREIEIDFQALVLDLAGNVGFSDADRKPDLINDLREESDDRLDTTRDNENGRALNVLGYFSRHVILLDDKDPEFDEDYPAVTGFYGLDSDDEPVPHGRGIMITFDNVISEDTITANTFTVELDDKSSATVDDFIVEENMVFLRLTADLKTSETPKVGLASGHRIEDLAGNQLHAREVSESVEVHDGLPPTLTVTLSGGSGTGEGKESSSRLTDETIQVTVSSDERLSEAHFAVLCPQFTYQPATGSGSSTTARADTDDYIEARSGSLVGGKPSSAPGGVKCGTVDKELTETRMRIVNERTNTWVDTWSDPDSLADGELTVVVYARDRSDYRLDPLDEDQDLSENWTAVTAKFTYDTVLNPLVVRNEKESGEVVPAPGDKASENRPQIFLRFEDASTVSLVKLLVDGRDVTAMVANDVRNQFIYWPDPLDQGTHKVEVDAQDTAGNETTFRYEFDVVPRAPFVVRLFAGWNAVSIPQQPVDGSLESVFKDPAIDQVIGYLRPSKDALPEWQVATRQDGVWTTNYGELTSIKAEQGYWVHTDSFVNQSVQLRSPQRLSQALPTSPISIKTYEGWNFVGVVDQDGDQTQNDWGQSLKQGDVVQTGRMYLGTYTRAYSWDATRSQFEALEPTDDMEIGDGIWVYYGAGVAP